MNFTVTARPGVVAHACAGITGVNHHAWQNGLHLKAASFPWDFQNLHPVCREVVFPFQDGVDYKCRLQFPKSFLDYSSLVAETKYSTPKMEEGKACSAQCVEASVHDQPAPRQRGMVPGQQKTAKPQSRSWGEANLFLPYGAHGPSCCRAWGSSRSPCLPLHGMRMFTL